jgi:transposase
MSNPLTSTTSADPIVPTLFVGVDWADQKHDVYWITADGRDGHRVIEQSAEAIEDLLLLLAELAGGGTTALALEKSRGPLQYALMFREHLQLYPIDPKQFARYRESFASGGGKSDLEDAALLARLLRERYRELKPLALDDEPTRRLAHLCQTRRLLVNDATTLKLQLQSLLKTFFPLLLELGRPDSGLVLEVLRSWPDPRQFRRVHPRTLNNLLRRHGVRNPDRATELTNRIRTAPLLTKDAPLLEAMGFRVAAIGSQLKPLLEAIAKLERAIDKAFAEHPDAGLLEHVPGAGQALAPRLLAAFGSDRERYANADEVATISGIAPITRQSGKTKVVLRRRACPRFLKQTFHEFADAARKWCPWSKAYYQLQRSHSMGHHAALRKLAKCWIRILYQVWKTRTPYDPERHLQRLQTTKHPLLAFLNQTEPATP